MVKRAALLATVLASVVFGLALGTTILAPASAATPKACVTALNDARTGFRIAGSAIGQASRYVPLIEKAALAGSDQNVGQINSIIATVKQINAAISSDASKMGTLAPAYNTEAALCLAS